MASSTMPRTPARWPRIAARVAEGILIVIALGALLLWGSVPQTAQLADNNPTSTAFIDLRREQAAAAGRPFTLAWRWRPIGEISRYLRASIIYAEDYNFYRHTGVDWIAIEKAIDVNRSRGSLSIGGSTITQQLAKNLYLSPSRSIFRKLREMLIAFSLEDHLGKQRILELYLNVVEWGDGVFGAEAAAQHWFKHSAQSLTPAEAVRLAIALPNPITRAPNVRSPALTKKAVRLIRLLRMQGLIDPEQEQVAYVSVGARGIKPLPSHATTLDLDVMPEIGEPDDGGDDAGDVVAPARPGSTANGAGTTGAGPATTGAGPATTGAGRGTTGAEPGTTNAEPGDAGGRPGDEPGPNRPVTHPVGPPTEGPPREPPSGTAPTAPSTTEPDTRPARAPDEPATTGAP